ncbi:MAG TPA: hypothetical protein VEZ90_00155 [Blastocatellia bacterium]|nr:hypothetical protein [Blastocatellia bacterium]
MRKMIDAALIAVVAPWAFPLSCFLFSGLISPGVCFLGDDGGPLSYTESLVAFYFCGRRLSSPDRLALIVLTILSLHIIAVWIERLVTFMRAADQSKRLRPLVIDTLRFGTLDSAREACARFNKSPEAPVAKAILAEVDRPGPKSTQPARLELADRRGRKTGLAPLRQGVPGLKFIAAISPLIALIAAAADIGGAFYNAVQREPLDKEAVVFLSLTVSRITGLVVFGFVVSLGSLLAYGVLSRRQAQLQAAMDDFADECLALSFEVSSSRKERSQCMSVVPKERSRQSVHMNIARPLGYLR